MVSERLKFAIWQYRSRGGRLYRLALDAGMSPSLLSATLSGARQVAYDERLERIGAALGLSPSECFTDEDAPRTRLWRRERERPRTGDAG